MSTLRLGRWHRHRSSRGAGDGDMSMINEDAQERQTRPEAAASAGRCDARQTARERLAACEEGDRHGEDGESEGERFGEFHQPATSTISRAMVRSASRRSAAGRYPA
jgi:hypothetical protein